MEWRWVVADADAYEEEDADEGTDEDEDVKSLSQSSHASEFKVKGGMPWIVRVSGAKMTSSMGRTASWQRLDTSRNRCCRRGHRGATKKFMQSTN